LACAAKEARLDPSVAATLEFGVIQPRTTKQMHFKIFNDGDMDLVISAVGWSRNDFLIRFRCLSSSRPAGRPPLV
jgi:hypothetical protein